MASEIAEVVGGQLVGDDVAVNGATIDSRSVSTGQLFVPIVAARDGHDFISAALDAGAPDRHRTDTGPTQHPHRALWAATLRTRVWTARGGNR